MTNARVVETKYLPAHDVYPMHTSAGPSYVGPVVQPPPLMTCWQASYTQN